MNTIGPPATGLGWDEASPAVDDARGNACYEIQDLRKGLRIRLEKEHSDMAVAGGGGWHLQGSAVAWAQTTAPTTRPDGSTDLDSDDLGRIWYDTDGDIFYLLTAVGTPDTWTPVAEIAIADYEAGSEPSRGIYSKDNHLYWKEDGGSEINLTQILDEDDMATDSASLPASQQSIKAFVTSGTVTMTNKTLTSPTINTGTLASPVLNTAVSGTAVLNEDDMATDSDTQIATQQSIKAYVDNEVAAHGVVQRVVTTDATCPSTQNGTFPSDDTIPQITEGNLWLSRAITPTNASNKLVIEVDFHFASSGVTGGGFCGAIFQDSTANALKAIGFDVNASNTLQNFTMRYEMVAGTTSGTTFTFRGGMFSTGHVLTQNGASGSRKLGGAMISSITVEEYEV